MMGRLKSDQGQLFYEFCLGEAFPKITWYGRTDLADAKADFRF
jgi:hypothetical protein